VADVPRAGLDKDPRDIAAMFDGVARHYDRTNTMLSFGQDRRWRRLAREAVGARPGERVLDLAAGTAVSTVELIASGGWCVAADFSLDMLRAGRHRKVPMVGADALALPFADGSFDVVAISFGLRNIADTGAALVELARVTRPGGRLVVCEFSTPTWRPLRVTYFEYLMRVLPAVARRVSSNPDAYVYLAESIRAWPDQQALAGRIAVAGWSEVGWRNFTGGVVAVHRARRPAPQRAAEPLGAACALAQ